MRRSTIIWRSEGQLQTDSTADWANVTQVYKKSVDIGGHCEQWDKDKKFIRKFIKKFREDCC